MAPTIVRTILLLALVLYSEAQAQKTVAPSTIKVMSFNIRYASNFGANSWPKRRSGVVQVIHDKKADLIGTQEGLHHQLLYMDKELKNHKWIGVGREGGNKGGGRSPGIQRNKSAGGAAAAAASAASAASVRIGVKAAPAAPAAMRASSAAA